LSKKFVIRKNSNLYKSLVEINEENIRNFMNDGNDNENPEHSDERRAAILEYIMKQYKKENQ